MYNKVKDLDVVINEEGFTYKAMMEQLNEHEVKLMVKIFEYMTDDNLIYLYQRVSKRVALSIIEQVAWDLRITKKTVQNMVSSILSKQEDMRYLMYKTASPIKGEYFISPHLALKRRDCYETVYRSVIAKLEREAGNTCIQR